MSIDPSKKPLFIAICPTGVIYADRRTIEAGDYKRVAFLAFDTLMLDITDNCPNDLRDRIVQDAGAIQSKSGQPFQISSSGHTILLGGGHNGTSSNRSLHLKHRHIVTPNVARHPPPIIRFQCAAARGGRSRSCT